MCSLLTFINVQCFFLYVCFLPLSAHFIQGLFALIPLFNVKVLSK